MSPRVWQASPAPLARQHTALSSLPPPRGLAVADTPPHLPRIPAEGGSRAASVPGGVQPGCVESRSPEGRAGNPLRSPRLDFLSQGLLFSCPSSP